MHRCQSLLLLCGAFLGSTEANAQDSIHRAIRAVQGRTTQLNVHGSMGANCVPGPPPPVRVTKPPANGSLSVRDGKLRSQRLRNCAQVEAPVRVVAYTANTAFAGQDELAYELTTASGKTETYNFTITVVPGPPVGKTSPPTTDL